MTTRFTISATDYDFLTDQVAFSESVVQGDQWIMVDGTFEADIIGVQVVATVRGVFEQVAGPSISAGELWRRGLSETITLRPDTSRSFTVDLRADKRRPPTWYKTRKGMAQRRQRLTLISALLAEGSQTLKDLASYQDSIQSQ